MEEAYACRRLLMAVVTTAVNDALRYYRDAPPAGMLEEMCGTFSGDPDKKKKPRGIHFKGNKSVIVKLTPEQKAARHRYVTARIAQDFNEEVADDRRYFLQEDSPQYKNMRDMCFNADVSFDFVCRNVKKQLADRKDEPEWLPRGIAECLDATGATVASHGKYLLDGEMVTEIHLRRTAAVVFAKHRRDLAEAKRLIMEEKSQKNKERLARMNRERAVAVLAEIASRPKQKVRMKMRVKK